MIYLVNFATTVIFLSDFCATDVRTTLLTPPTQKPSPRHHRAVLGILFALGMVVGCKELAVTYTVTFNTNGGTAVAATKVQSGKRVQRPTPDPTKEDNVFADWYADKGLTQRYDFAIPVTKNITLYARWAVPPTGITITGAATVGIGGSMPLGIKATPSPADARVTWTIEGNDASNSKGTINATGLYKAPNAIPTPPTVTVKATSVVDTEVSDSHTITIVLAPTAITITGATAVNVTDSTRLGITPTPPSAYARVTWTIAGNDASNSKGTIDTTGLYTAPASIPTPATIIIEATSAVTKGISDTSKVTITNLVTIPDANFRAALQELVPNAFEGDSLNASHPDVTGRTRLNVNNNYNTPADKKISNLRGIEYFTSLDKLRCSGNKLDTLDVSHNTALTWLDCNDNSLIGLDVSANTALKELMCENNQLTDLDVSANTSLTGLNCFNNQLKHLDVSADTSLTGLYCRNNKLTDLDVSTNTALMHLSCKDNQLKRLDVSTNTALTLLLCNNNELTDLGVSHNTALTRLDCFNNQLTALDVSTNTALTLLDCHNNELTDLDIIGMRSATELVINAGVEGKNLLTTLKVHVNLKDDDEIKEAKTSRGDTLKIMTYTTPYARSTDYTLSCASYAPATSECISPTSFTVASAEGVDSVRTSTTLQFSITDVDPTDADGRVTWTITDNDASDSKGTIDADGGLYTAPATVPSPATVTITATSTVAPAISNTFEITVKP